MWDVVIIGAGPAGLAAGASCAEAGLSACVVDPQALPCFYNTYGVWVDEVPLPDACIADRWSRPLFFSDHGGARALDRTYGHLHNARFVAWLQSRLLAAGGRLTQGRVAGLSVDPEHVTIGLRDGLRELRARVVVDCTGAAQRFLETTSRRRPVAWQTAYGIFATVDGRPWDDDEMVLMDYRTLPDRDPSIASFLYALPLSDGTVLLDETVLAAAPAVPIDRLRRRLDERLEQLGIRVRTVHEVENVSIPMNAPLPRMPQPIVGFGGAGGFVHPATGYSVSRSLTQAPVLAGAIARGLDQQGPRRAVDLAWAAIHPPALRRAQRLARSGLEVLIRLDAPDVGHFMHSFFGMPDRHWSAFLSGTAPSGELACAMFRLGGHLPLSLLARVAGVSMRRGGADLLLGLVPGLERHVP